MKKILTLLIIHKDDKVLLGLKKRGFGMGKWNGFGGKVDKGETIEEAAKRELFEEAGLAVNDMEKAGVLDFEWASFAKASAGQAGPSEVWEVNIFKATDFSGEPQETEEMKPQWFLVNEIPFEKMWADDKYWFPLFFAGKKFTGKFVFDGKNNIIEHQLHENSGSF